MNKGRGNEMKEKQEEAVKFLHCMRGQYIISQALYTAIKAMEKKPKIHREVSNISDMQFLLDNLFPIYKSIAAAEEIKEQCQTCRKEISLYQWERGKGLCEKCVEAIN